MGRAGTAYYNEHDAREGARFGKLTVLSTARGAKNRHPTARCRCDCGTERIVRQSRLRCGQIIECGRCALRTGWTKRARPAAAERFLRAKESEYRCNARSRQIQWSLDRETFRGLFTAACTYCGISPAHGLDRWENDSGYTPENARSCCAQCNFAKRDQSPSDFEAWLDRITLFRGGAE